MASASTKTNVSAQVNTSNSSLSQYEWSQFQGDSSFTRLNAGPAPDTSNVLWKTNVAGIQPYITAFNGLIYVGTNDSIVAMDQTGQIAWKTQIPMNRTWPIAYKIDASHLVSEGSCLDPNTGRLLWTSTSFSSDTGIFTANVYSPEQKMFYVKTDSYIVAWGFSNPSNPPTVAWKTFIPGGGETGLGTTYGGGMVFASSFENQQFALNASTGQIIWGTLLKGPAVFNGAYSDGRFFRGGTDDNTMYCFNATNGQIIWSYTPQGDTDGYFTSGPAVAYGMVYEMNKDGYLYALNVENGNVAWKYKGPDETLLWPGMPAVADGKVYVTTGEVAMYGGQVGVSEFACINAYTGDAIWKLPIEALAPRESIAIAYGNLYIIPGSVTTAVDSINGGEYSTNSQVWAIGSTSIPVSSWPMWRADATHSSIATVGPSNLSVTWKFATDGAVISSPSVANGIVYFGSQDKNIYAVGAWSGSLLWKFSTQGAVESSPAVANGKVYIGSDDGYVYCLDAYTGSLIWKTNVNGDQQFTFASVVLKSSPVVSGGIVYIGSLDGYLYALDADNGNLVWRSHTEGQIESSPAVADGAVFFTAAEPTAGALYKLDAATGASLWKIPLPYQPVFTGGIEMLGSPCVANGTVFTSSDIGTYFGINEATGNIIWTFKDPEATEFILSSPIYANGHVFIIDKFNIACLDATDGKTLWSSYTGDELNVSPSYADGKIYVATSERHIFILDANNNGEKISLASTPSSSWSSPTIANGKLYIGCNDWNVYCFSNQVNSEVSPSPTPKNSNQFGSLTLIAVVLVALIVAVVALGYVVRKRSRKPL